ncbi:MAG: hypothetical protein K9H49_16005 [Bacteroidales bacterium]|nr:hypothetical protein [Bacteroidales bacterium]MCF8390381.1 hypothetical protein [Bacteroidales bacterium]
MKIKSVYSLVFILLLFSLNGYSQEEGETIFRIYSNFYKGLTEEDNSTAFEISRIYLGYKGNINENFSAEAKLDIGSPEDQSQYSLVNRYAYFKTAYLEYHKDNLQIYFGLFGMMQFDIQEKIWGYRYISKSFMDEFKYGPSADIGIGARYKLNEFIITDMVISNGEGYKSLQEDDSYKTAFGLSVLPTEKTMVRVYYDFINKESLQSVFATFISFTGDDFRFGAEYNKLYNKSFVENQDLKGYSVYGTFTLNEKWGLFGRFDYLSSNILAEEILPWNLYNDGSSITSGIEYTPVKNIHCALNYQDWVSLAANGPYKSYIYFNIEFKL